MVAACGSSARHVAATSTTSTTTAPPLMADEVGRVEAGAATIVTRSFHTLKNGTSGEIDIFEGRHQVASMPAPAPGIYDDADARKFYVDDVTGDDEPDVFVRLIAASVEPWTIVSNDGGSWRRLPFEGSSNSIVTFPSVPQNGRFTTMSRICEPSCADGGGRFDTWRYDRTKAEFVVTASVSCAHFDEACTFAWRDRQTLGSLR